MTEWDVPGSPGYAAATAVFNLHAPPAPDAAITVGTPEEACAVVSAAAARGVGVRVHTTGHAAGAVRPVRDGLLVRTRIGGGVQVDPQARVVRIPAGTAWGEVVEAVGRHGLAVAHGSAATVGAIGYLLRGGMSFYGRSIGLAGNTVRAVELVTADGRVRRVDAANDPELFRALRGGGGGFGIVTAVEVGLFPLAGVVTGAAFWSFADADRLLPLWLEWTRSAPERATTSIRVMNLPPLPELPPVLTSGPLFVVDGAVLASTAEELDDARGVAADLLEPLRRGASPLMDSWALAAPSAVLGVHMDPADPIPFVGDHMVLGELDDVAAESFLKVTGPDSGSPMVVAGLRQLGGRYAVGDPAGGVLDRLDGRFSYAGSGPAFDEATADALRAHAAVVRAALAPWDTGRTVPGFVEDFDQPQRHLDADQVRAVDAVRVRVDPAGMFRGDVAPGATALDAT